MPPSVWLNIGSLALGLLAWVLPAAALTLGRRGPRSSLLPAAGLTACALSLFLVLCYLEGLVRIGAWSALMDTARAFRLSAAVLLAGALPLNLLALLLPHRQERRAPR